VALEQTTLFPEIVGFTILRGHLRFGRWFAFVTVRSRWLRAGRWFLFWNERLAGLRDPFRSGSRERDRDRFAAAGTFSCLAGELGRHLQSPATSLVAALHLDEFGGRHRRRRSSGVPAGTAIDAPHLHFPFLPARLSGRLYLLPQAGQVT